MAEEEPKSRLISEVTLPDNNTIKKWENTDGNVRYTRNGNFLSPDIGKGLEQTTELAGKPDTPGGSMTQAELSEYGHGITSEELRTNRISNKYREWNDIQMLDLGEIPGGSHNKESRYVIGWANNESLIKAIDNDPLIETEQERDMAREALARQVIKDLEDKEGDEAARIIESYNWYHGQVQRQD